MKTSPEIALQKYISLSRKVFWFGWALSFILAGVVAAIIIFLQPEWSWLKDWNWLIEGIIYRPLLAFSFLSIIISLVTPGLSFISLRPELGAAWLRGINPIAYRKPWEELSDGTKLYAFLHAMIFLAMGVFIAYQLISNLFK